MFLPPCLESSVVRPPLTGRLLDLRCFLKYLKTGRGDALRKETGLFLHTLLDQQKSMASGGTRPAGSVCGFQQKMEEQINKLQHERSKMIVAVFWLQSVKGGATA